MVGGMEELGGSGMTDMVECWGDLLSQVDALRSLDGEQWLQMF